jgi:nitroreductase
MNEVIANIKKRRSTRGFSPEQIKDEELKAILEAGTYAPSGQNTQSWFFTVLQNPGVIEKVNSWIIEEARFVNDAKAQEIASTPNALIFRKAPTVVIVSGDTHDGLAVENCCCAAQNIMLAAESLGIGSCWICYAAFLGLRPTWKDYRAKLQIPEGYIPHFAITLGYKTGPDGQAYPRRKGVIKVFR